MHWDPPQRQKSGSDQAAKRRWVTARFWVAQNPGRPCNRSAHPLPRPRPLRPAAAINASDIELEPSLNPVKQRARLQQALRLGSRIDAGRQTRSQKNTLRHIGNGNVYRNPLRQTDPGINRVDVLQALIARGVVLVKHTTADTFDFALQNLRVSDQLDRRLGPFFDMQQLDFFELGFNPERGVIDN